MLDNLANTALQCIFVLYFWVTSTNDVISFDLALISLFSIVRGCRQLVDYSLYLECSSDVFPDLLDKGSHYVSLS